MADDTRLREMYAAATAAPQAPHPSEADWEHLAMGELPSAERETLLDHVVRCAACAQIYRGLQDLEAGAREFDPGVPKKAAVVLPFRPAVAWSVGLAAAAALVIAFLLPLRRLPSASDDAVRSPTAQTPTAIAPVGDLAAPPDSFRWTPLAGSDRHRIELSSADGERVWTSADVDGSQAARPAEIRLAPGVYYWRVVAVPDPDRRLASPVASPTVSFRIAP
jgi:hypothetical protein